MSSRCRVDGVLAVAACVTADAVISHGIFIGAGVVGGFVGVGTGGGIDTLVAGKTVGLSTCGNGVGVSAGP